MAKVITTPSRRAAFFPMPNTRSTDHSLPLSSSLRSVLKTGSKTPHSMPIHSFDHVATLNAMSAELHQVMTQVSSSCILR